ncbi:MAG: leucyl aminopeptidase [Acidimicrobiia bacterium]|nr:leucyl aminopeptidase [Acidimicrobiia bacterium]
MTIEVKTAPTIAKAADRSGVLVVPVHEGLAWGPGAGEVADALGDDLTAFLAASDFTGAAGKTAAVPGGPLGFARVLLVGVGTELDAEGLRRAAAVAGRATTAAETVATTLATVDIEGAADLVVFGFSSGQYRFDRHRSEPKAVRTTTLTLVGAGKDRGDTGGVLARAVAGARDLVNEPAAGKPPTWLAQWASDQLGAVGVSVEVWDEKRIVEERLGGLAAVSWGSAQPPRLVRMHYKPRKRTGKLAFVGKGIVFDSGGLSIKPAEGMMAMKTDMAGAAAVFGAMWAIASLKLPVEVIGFTPLTENMPGGRAVRPGDVFTARNGKTVEVLNTDAEGRLVLADGLSLAAEEKPDLIVDVATLTGACKVALGERIAGLFASDDEVASRLLAAAADAGEPLWRLPLEKEYRSKIDSPVADMKNTGDKFGGAISAALLLERFVDDRPWAHLDVAGPARSETDEHYLTKGGTGFGVRTLVALAAQTAAS